MSIEKMLCSQAPHLYKESGGKPNSYFHSRMTSLPNCSDSILGRGDLVEDVFNPSPLHVGYGDRGDELGVSIYNWE